MKHVLFAFGFVHALLKHFFFRLALFVLNVDVSVFIDFNYVGFHGVIRDHNESFLHGFLPTLFFISPMPNSCFLGHALRLVFGHPTCYLLIEFLHAVQLVEESLNVYVLELVNQTIDSFQLKSFWELNVALNF